MEKIQMMKKHLNNYKDAIIFVGEDVVNELNLFKFSEKNKNSYSRKKLVKSSLEFWSYYLESAFSDGEETIEQNHIRSLINTGIAKTVIDLNNDANLKNVKGVDYIPLCGHQDMFYCSKCGDTINISKAKLSHDLKNKINKVDTKQQMPLRIDPLLHNDVKNCECDGRITPSIPFFGNKIYDIDLVDSIGNAIFLTENNNFIGLNTHTLIFIGVDFNDGYIQNIIDNFNLFKWRNQNEEFLKIIITERKESDLDIYGADFGTSDSITSSIDRLTKLMQNK